MYGIRTTTLAVEYTCTYKYCTCTCTYVHHTMKSSQVTIPQLNWVFVNIHCMCPEALQYLCNCYDNLSMETTYVCTCTVRMYMYCTYGTYVSQCSMYIVYMCAVWMCLSLHSLVRLTSCLVTVKIWKCSMRCTGAYCGTWGKGACRRSFVFLHVYVSVHYTCKYNYSTYMYMYIVLYCLQYDYTYKHATGLSKYW